MICVSIGKASFEECMKALNGLDFAEIRIDKMKLSEQEVQKIFSQPLKLIATCRPCSFDNNKRKTLLLSAIETGAAFVDLEVESPDEYKKEIIEKAKSVACGIIVSYHNYEKTPSTGELEQIIGRCSESGADIVKIACRTHSEKDNARLIGLLNSSKKIVVVGMGDKGKITRIVAPILGSPFTFASLEEGNKTAEGQIERRKLQHIIYELKRLSE